MKQNNLGIPSNGFEYQKLSYNQNPIEEYIKTNEFLRKVFLQDLKNIAPHLYDGEISLQFINYGDTQLVYVFETSNQLYTVLVGQPSVEKGVVKQEYDNLLKLHSKNKELVIKPEYYFSDQERELYITPYLLQARCIASQNGGWGIYIPEPYYHFEYFTKEEQFYVNSSIIANLVKLYDEEEEKGVAACKIGGGDFILERKWSQEPKSLDNTLSKMKLIAAREMISTSLDNYLDLIRKEFSLRTYYRTQEERDLSILINHKARIPMQEEEIENGIQLGLRLRYK